MSIGYYDWNKTLSYDAPITLVVTVRGRGKTYGLRQKCVNAYAEKGEPWLEVVRTKSEIDDVDINGNYFDRLLDNGHVPAGFDFASDAKGLWAKGLEDDSTWQRCGYWAALSQQQRKKKATYPPKIRRIIFDEAILDREERRYTYLPGEVGKLANLIDSVTRERGEQKARLYLLGNSCDLLNPYFEKYGIDKVPEYGYRWFNGKTCLLHYEEDPGLGVAKATGSLAGILAQGTSAASVITGNDFSGLACDKGLIARKSSRAEYLCTLISGGNRMAVWVDVMQNLYYVCAREPKAGKHDFAIAAEDMTVTYIGLRRAKKIADVLIDAYYVGALRFDTERMYSTFALAMRAYGMR